MSNENAVLSPEVLALQAELEAAKAEIAKLKSKGERKSTKAAGIPEDQMAPEDTLLGQVQRKDRATMVDAFAKLARMLSPVRASELIVEIAGEVAAATESTADKVVETVTTRAPKKAKGEKVVEDNTSEGGEPAGDEA